MIFLYFIQEKTSSDRNPNYLHEQPGEVVDDSEDRYENFYRPLFFDYLAEDKQNPDFGSLPYLNGGLFAKNPVEEEFPEAKLGSLLKKQNELFDDILDFLSGWNWNVDERLDIVDPKNLSPLFSGISSSRRSTRKRWVRTTRPRRLPASCLAGQSIHICLTSSTTRLMPNTARLTTCSDFPA